MLAQRITYVGELGYELYLTREWAVQVWDELMRAASPEPVGYTALDSLRIEKGYRYFGADMTSSDTPFEAGVGFCVAKGKRPELDRSPGAAAAHARRRRGGVPDGVRRRGGACGGGVVGRVRSAAYGFTVQRNVALAKLPAALDGGGGGPRRRARRARACVVAPDALYDPANERVRA